MTPISKDDKIWADDLWEKIKAKMSTECKRVGTKVPYIAVNGQYIDKMAKDLYWWTNSFYPGILWLMYHDTKDEIYRKNAEGIEDRFDDALSGFEGLHHDVGFQWTLTSRLSYQLTQNPKSRVRALHAANLLAGRYNPKGRFIRSWNAWGGGIDTTGWVIIDCMMNLPLLYWASDEIKDPRFRYIAMEHADTAAEKIVRGDGSCNHIISLDPETGALLETPRGQGYAVGSSWTRGQAWALYGFALSYSHTKEEKYLNVSKKIAHYFLSSVTRYDFIPPVDFRSPLEPVKIDTSAGMIASCGLLHLADSVPEYEKSFYLDGAMKLLKNISAKYADWDPDRDSIIQKGTAQYHDKLEEFEVPLIYSDYFFIEAIHRIQYPDFRVW